MYCIVSEPDLIGLRSTDDNYYDCEINILGLRGLQLNASKWGVKMPVPAKKPQSKLTGLRTMVRFGMKTGALLKQKEAEKQAKKAGHKKPFLSKSGKAAALPPTKKSTDALQNASSIIAVVYFDGDEVGKTGVCRLDDPYASDPLWVFDNESFYLRIPSAAMAAVTDDDDGDDGAEAAAAAAGGVVRGGMYGHTLTIDIVDTQSLPTLSKSEKSKSTKIREAMGAGVDEATQPRPTLLGSAAFSGQRLEALLGGRFSRKRWCDLRREAAYVNFTSATAVVDADAAADDLAVEGGAVATKDAVEMVAGEVLLLGRPTVVPVLGLDERTVDKGTFELEVCAYNNAYGGRGGGRERISPTPLCATLYPREK
jgi:hypothetical protein